MSDEPTLGEVVRRLEHVHLDLKEDFRDLAGRLDSKVSMERYQLEQQAGQDRERTLSERLRALEEAREQERQDAEDERRRAADRRRADRRLLFTALVAPVLLIVLQVYLNSQGAGA